MPFENACRRDVPLLFAGHVHRACEHDDDAVATVVNGPLHRNRVRDATVEVRDVVDHHRLACHRYRGTRLEYRVVVLTHVRFVEVARRAVLAVCRHDGEGRRIVAERGVIQRVLAVAVTQRAIHVVEIAEVAFRDVVLHARIFLAERVLRVERVRAALLPRQI